MKRSDLIARLAERQKLPMQDVVLAVDTILNAISDRLSKGQRTEIRGFGVFETRYRAARISRNPKTGERVSVPAKPRPAFRQGKLLLNALNLAPKKRTPSAEA